MEPMIAEEAYKELAVVSPLFRQVWDAEIEEWKDDGGVPGTILFGHFARALAKEFKNLDKDQLNLIFVTLESFLVRGDKQVGEIVTTGFFDSLLSNIANGRLQLDVVKPLIGLESAKYCDAWDSKTFRGVGD